jgi:cell pole-organizing protein PopZ
MFHTTSLCTVMAGVSFISPDVRSEIARVIADGPAGHFSAMASRAVDFVHMLLPMLPDYRGDNLPYVVYGFVALVLTVMMIKS